MVELDGNFFEVTNCSIRQSETGWMDFKDGIGVWCTGV